MGTGGLVQTRDVVLAACSRRRIELGRPLGGQAGVQGHRMVSRSRFRTAHRLEQRLHGRRAGGERVRARLARRRRPQEAGVRDGAGRWPDWHASGTTARAPASVRSSNERCVSCDCRCRIVSPPFACSGSTTPSWSSTACCTPTPARTISSASTVPTAASWTISSKARGRATRSEWA